LVIELASERRLPGMYVLSLMPRSGGLVSYGVNAQDLYRRCARYVSRLLKGAKPSELPIERPTRFELVVNLRTAKTLGLTIPPSVLERADEIIE
jgi:putative ABC transport system substrate-binding protein